MNEWLPISEHNRLSKGDHVVISDGTGWAEAYATGDGGFVSSLNEMMEWREGITHFCIITLPVVQMTPQEKRAATKAKTDAHNVACLNAYMDATGVAVEDRDKFPWD